MSSSNSQSCSVVPPPSAAAAAAAASSEHSPREQTDQQQSPTAAAEQPAYDDFNGARFPAVLEPTGRSALELYGEQVREAEVLLTLLVRTWPEWRQKVSRFVRFDPWFERAIFSMIVVNALVIVLDSIVEGTSSPTDSLKGLAVAVDVLDNFVTWAFVLEMFAKFVGLGFWNNGSGYFGNFGNWVDFVINVFSVYATIQEMVSSVGLGNAASAVRSVRLLRTFRAVKVLRHLRLLVDALFVALRRLVDVGLLYLIFIVFMMFIGLQLFQGRYSRNCVVPVENSSALMYDENGTLNDTSVVFISPGRNNDTVYWTTTTQICDVGMPQEEAEKIARLPKNTTYVWEEPFQDVNHFFTGYICPYGQWCKGGLETPERNLIGFENIYFALMSLTTVSVFENWDVVMYDGMYARGFAASWYFLTVAFVGSIFVLNLVLAILTDAFTQSLTILRKELDEQIDPFIGDDDHGGLIKDDDEEGEENDDAPLIKDGSSSSDAAGAGAGEPEKNNSATGDEVRKSDSDSHQRRRGGSQRRRRGTSAMASMLSFSEGNRNFSHMDSAVAGNRPRARTVGFAAASNDNPSFGDAYRDFDAEEEELAQDTARRRYGRGGGSSSDIDATLSGLVPPGGYQVNRRARSYSLVNELRRKVNTNRDFSMDANKVTGEELDQSLDWFSNEWALVVLESRKNEDLETMAASELNEQNFDNDGGWRDRCFGKYRRFQSWVLQNVVATPVFNVAGFVLTIINVVILSIVFPKMDPTLRTTLQTFSIILSMVFVLESIMRIVGLGWRTFARDPFNVLDGLLAMVSIFELGLAGSTAISAIRTIRLLRMLSYFPSIVSTLRTLAAAVKAAASLMVQLFIMIFVMAVLGQQLFRGQLCGLDESPEFLGVTPSKLCTQPGQLSPVFNFDSLSSSVVTVFVVVAGDGWRQFWIDCSSRTTRYHSLYFIAIYVMGNYLFVNLFVAVLIDAANTSRAAGEEEQKQSSAEPGSEKSLQNVAATGSTSGSYNNNELEAPLDSRRGGGDAGGGAAGGENGQDQNNNNNNSSKKEEDEKKTPEDDEDWDAVPEDALNPIARFHRNHVPYTARVIAARIVLHPVAKTLVGVSSFAASISYLFWMDARTYPDHWSMTALDVIEVIAATISTVDSLLRWVALGRTCSYLVQFINFVSYLTLIFQFSRIPSRSTVVAICRVFTRAIRPWTYALKFARFRLVFYSLTRAVSALRSVGVIALLMWFTYGVLGAQLFHGKLYACTEGRLEENWGDQTYKGNFIDKEGDCLARNYTWLGYKYNFDNVGKGMLALVTAATTDDWSNIMYLTTGTESDQYDIAPQPGKYLAYAFFMCSFVVLMAFFLINVILSVLVDAYFTTKKQMEDSAAKMSDAKQREKKLAELANDLDAETGQPKPIQLDCAGELDVLGSNQQDFYDMSLHALLLVKPTMPVFFGPDSWRWKVRSFIRSRHFNYIYLGLTVLDFVMQATQFVDNPPMSAWALLQFDIVMSILLLCLTACRIIGNSCSGFMLQSSNILEIVVNVTIFLANICETITFSVYNSQQMSLSTESNVAKIDDSFKTFQQFQVAGVIFGLLRNLRMFRFQRILNTFHGVRVIVFTLRTSARNFLGGLTLVFLVYYFFGALGVALFGRVVNNGTGLTRNNNFASIPLAMQTLVRVGTLDDWEAVMRAAGLDIFPCESRLGNCGTPWLSTPFFYLFIVFGQWVAMSSFVAILLDSFSKADRRERFAVQKEDVDRFRKLWKMFCDNKTQLLSVAKLPLLLQRLGPALSIEEEGFVAEQAVPGSQIQVSDMVTRLAGMKGSGDDAVEMSSRKFEEGANNNNGAAGEEDEAERTVIDYDGANAGEEFARAVLLKKTIDRTALATKFCTLRRAQQYVRELRVSARETDSFSGVVTQRQVFEACIKHHYAVPLPASYEHVLEKQFELTFPLDVFRLTQALASQHGASLKEFKLPDGQASCFDVTNADHLLQLIRLQAWWRGLRFNRVVRAALKRAREESESNPDIRAETSAAIEALIAQSSRQFGVPETAVTTSKFSNDDDDANSGLTSPSTASLGKTSSSEEKNSKPKRKPPPSPKPDAMSEPAVPSSGELPAAMASEADAARKEEQEEENL